MQLISLSVGVWNFKSRKNSEEFKYLRLDQHEQLVTKIIIWLIRLNLVLFLVQTITTLSSRGGEGLPENGDLRKEPITLGPWEVVACSLVYHNPYVSLALRVPASRTKLSTAVAIIASPVTAVPVQNQTR